MRKIKIIFLIPNLKIGGAERTFTNIINNIDKRKYSCILALYKKEGYLINKINKNVKVINLSASNSFTAIIKLVKEINLHNPDILFSTLRYPNAAIYFASLLTSSRPRVIMRETNNFTAANLKVNFLERIVSLTYQKADRLIALSKGVAKDLIIRHQVKSSRVSTIYNPIDISLINKEKFKNITGKMPEVFYKKNILKIITVGNLKKQKGHDILIKAVNRIKHINFCLLIVGEGEEREELNKLIKKLKLSEKVFLIGQVNNPYNLIHKSDIFILPSRWEGFGHVIAESMVVGTPVISTNCKSGPNEIISNKVDGILCKINSPSDLNKNILFLAKNKKLQKNLSKNAMKNVKRFNIHRIVKEYENIFLSEYRKINDK